MKSVKEHISAVVAEIESVMMRVNDTRVIELVDEIESADKIIVAGAGKSGLMARAFCMRLMHLGVPAFVAGETSTPPLNSRDLLFIASGSGSTESVAVMARKARNDIGSRIALITIDATSTIAHLADRILVIPAPSPKLSVAASHQPVLKSRQPMGSLFEQCLLLTFDLIVLLYMEKTGTTSSEMFERHANLE
jgi:6-phospho-3-hexuloisomerase